MQQPHCPDDMHDCISVTMHVLPLVPQELEDTVVQCLERGVEVESDVISNIKTVLPTEAANMLTSIIPEPPTRASSSYTGAQVRHVHGTEAGAEHSMDGA